MGVWTRGPWPASDNDVCCDDAPGASETLTLADAANVSGSGNTLASAIAGDSGNNTLNGGDGADTLEGFGGADTLNGGAGNDFLYGHSAGASSAITANVVASGLAAPVAATAAPGDAGFLYVVEKDSGIIWRMDVATGARTQFLDIPNAEFTRDGERGVLGLAFHPDYAANGRFFVFLTDAQGDVQVREYTRSTNPAVANTTSSLVIEVPRDPALSNHNGGWIGFSPADGFLYIAIGDGGGGGDPSNNAQNLNVLLGKILRIDVNNDAFPGDATRNYANPASNPFVNITGADEIWAYGVRNPWRLAFDPRNGDLYIADVGQSAREEVDYRAAGAAGGANFGWRIMEGTLPFNPGPPGTPQPGDPSLVLPIYEYGRSIGTSITGGEVYVGPQAGFVGQYVFADFGSGRLFSLSVVNGAAVGAVDRTMQVVSASGPLSNIVDFATDSAGALYAIGIGGTIWRLTPAAGAEDLGDILNGGDGDDFLNGGAGADTLDGGAGTDTADYSTSQLSVIVSLASGAGSGGEAQGDTLANMENLNGGAANDALIGNGLVNVLNGNGGADYMAGGASNDTYIVDNAGDNPVELSGEGANDIIYATVSYAMTANVETMFLTGTVAYGVGNAQSNTIVGNDAFNELQGLDGNDILFGRGGADLLYGQNGADLLYGEAGADALIGGDGGDVLDGGTGVDYLLGGTGDDFYFVDNIGDNPLEDAGGGADTIYASTNYTMTANVETMFLTGAALYGVGNAGANSIVGNANNNEIRGLAGADFIAGGLGSDLLFGGADADTFVYTAAADSTAANLDAILDFQIGADHIDLTAVRTGASDSFFFTTSGGNTFLHVDLGGNGSEDMLINVFGVTGLTNTDVIWG